MSHRSLSLAFGLGLALASQVSVAALLTTPAQNVTFCVGFCVPRVDDSGIIKQQKPATETTLSKDESVTRSFNAFNPTLGILRSVSFTLNSAIFGNFFGEGTVGPSDTPGTVNLFSLLIDPKLSLPGFDVLFDAPELDSLLMVSRRDANPPSGAGAEARNASKTLSSPSTDLSFFTNGSTFDAEFLHRLTLTNSRPDNTSLTGNAVWRGTLSLQYAYEERPTETVPEPGTLALVGLGLLSGVAGLRKRNAQAS